MYQTKHQTTLQTNSIVSCCWASSKLVFCIAPEPKPGVEWTYSGMICTFHGMYEKFFFFWSSSWLFPCCKLAHTPLLSNCPHNLLSWFVHYAANHLNGNTSSNSTQIQHEVQLQAFLTSIVNRKKCCSKIKLKKNVEIIRKKINMENNHRQTPIIYLFVYFIFNSSNEITNCSPPVDELLNCWSLCHQPWSKLSLTSAPKLKLKV